MPYYANLVHVNLGQTFVLLGAGLSLLLCRIGTFCITQIIDNQAHESSNSNLGSISDADTPHCELGSWVEYGDQNKTKQQ